MPADAYFLQLITEAIHNQGGTLIEFPSLAAAPNPFRFVFELDDISYGALIHVRRITPQRGVDTTHHRPAGEWHAQMIFDNSQRGAGVRNRLQTDPPYPTVLFGYGDVGGTRVIVAWDATFHEEHAYSKSLQVRQETLDAASNDGIAQQQRTTGEIIVAFRVEHLPDYLGNRAAWHRQVVTHPAVPERRPHAEGDEAIAPPDELGIRARRTVSATQAVRDIRFRSFLQQRYEQCATCGLGIPALLEAAHIIPITDPRGTDHFSNGLLLCRNCHRLFDTGLLRINPTYEIELDPRTPDVARLQGNLVDTLILPDLPQEFRPDPEKLRHAYQLRTRQAI